MSSTVKLARVLRGDRSIREITAVSGSSVSTDALHVYRGNGVTMRFGIFLDASTPDSLADMASVTVQYQDERGAASATVAKTVAAADITNEITVAGYNGGTEFHFEVEFTNAEMNPDLGNATQKTYWLVIHGIDSDGRERTFAAGDFLTIEEDGSGAAPGSPPQGETAIDAEAAAGLVETKIGVVHLGTIAAGAKSGDVPWGETLASAPDAADLMAMVQPTDLSERAGMVRVKTISTTKCVVETTSKSHASALSVWVIRRV